MRQEKYAYKLAKKIEDCYAHYRVGIKIMRFETADNGNRIIFHAMIIPGTKISSIFQYAEEVQSLLALPFFQPFKEQQIICFAVSTNSFIENSLKKILTSQAFCKSTMGIPIAVGYDLRGEMRIVDLKELVHLLVVGASNTGKSISLRSLIFSILTLQSVSKVNLIMFDIGADSLDMFGEIPHLSCPIVKDMATGISVMSSLAQELERRVNLTSEEMEILPSIVCIVDEFVSFVTSVKDKEDSKLLNDAITNLLRRGRHAHIHLVLSTQDSKAKSLEIALSSIRARMAFACASSYASVNVLGVGGAEDLPGNGAMLFKMLRGKDPVYLQGAYISDEDTQKAVNGKGYKEMISADYDYSKKFIISEDDLNFDSYQTSFTPEKTSESQLSKDGKEFASIIMWLFSQNFISANKIEAQFRMSKRSSIILDKLAQLGLITEKFSKQPRKVIPQSIGDVPTDVMGFLLANGISSGDIESIFQNRERSQMSKTADILSV